MQIGRLLIAKKLLGEIELQQALAEQLQSANGQRLGAILVRQGVVSEASLYVRECSWWELWYAEQYAGARIGFAPSSRHTNFRSTC